MAEKKRGYCAVCERDIVLCKDGTLRHHGGPIGTGRRVGRDRAYCCEGAGKPPSERSTE